MTLNIHGQRQQEFDLHCCSALTIYGHKTAEQQTVYSNTVIGTLAVDGWDVIFGTTRRGLGGLRFAQSPPRCTKCNRPPINGQCTNFI